MVYFGFTDNKEQVKVHKSVLIKQSAFFKDMFEGNLTNDEPLIPIIIDDEIIIGKYEYDAFEAFLLFAGALYEDDLARFLKYSDPNYIVVDRYYRVYHFADKYQIIKLAEQCRELTCEEIQRFTNCKLLPRAMESVLASVKLMSMDTELENVNKLELAVTKENVVECFNLVKKWDIEEFKDQVVTYCCLNEFDPSWPTELIALVVKRFQDQARS